MQREHLRIQTGRFQRTRGVADFALAGQNTNMSPMRGEGGLPCAAPVRPVVRRGARGGCEIDREAAAWKSGAGIEKAREFFAIKRGTIATMRRSRALAPARRARARGRDRQRDGVRGIRRTGRADAVEHRVVPIMRVRMPSVTTSMRGGAGGSRSDAVATVCAARGCAMKPAAARAATRGSSITMLPGEPWRIQQGQWHAWSCRRRAGLPAPDADAASDSRIAGSRIDRKGGAHAAARVADQRARAGWWP